MKAILDINAHLKYVEYLLAVFDTAPAEKTLKEIRDEFEKCFSTRLVLLNQNFGIYRLLPLIMIKEEYKKGRKELTGIIEQIKIIRDSIVHNNFSINEDGYCFKNDQGNIFLSFDDFVSFLHKVENEFYEERIQDRKSHR